MACLVLPVFLLTSTTSSALAQGMGSSFGQGFGQTLQTGFGQPSNNALDNPALNKAPQKALEKERTLDDFFPKTDTPYGLAPPYDLRGVKVPGLDAASIPRLSQNLFVVSDNTPYTSMSELYRDNRLKGKSSFVTADCVVHPYFALNNKILRDVIYQKVMPGLSLMLQSMLKVGVEDYKEADDPEVKNDISKNIAYILVALQLLDPNLKLPDLGSSSKSADAELINIAAGKIAKSAIFGNEEEYAFFRPTGFYEREPKLRNFYRCRQWLSRIEFPLTDSDLNDRVGGDQPESRFRQSVLLFHCVDKATVNGAPALDYWGKYFKVWQLMGARENAHEHPLLPTDYKAVFKTSSQNLTNVLQGLSEPFFRTKLLLSIRRNRPVELNSASILSVKRKDSQQVERAVFRFMPLVDEPELPWLADLAQRFSEQKSSAESTPFALLELYGRGSTLATNILADTSWKLDGDLFALMPQLIDVTGRKRAIAPAPLDAGSQEGRWLILSNYFKPMTESPQNALKTDQWMRRRLLSAFAGWVDSHVALMTPSTTAVAAGDAPLPVPDGAKTSPSSADDAPLPMPNNSSVKVTSRRTATAQATAAVTSAVSKGAVAAAPSAASTTATAARSGATMQAGKVSQSAAPSTEQPPAAGAGAGATAATAEGAKPAHVPLNYLEPAPTLYKSLRTKMQQTLDDLSSIDYLPEESKQSAQDLINLCQKLEEIAKKEISNNIVAPKDSLFLGAIDEELEKFPAPLEAVFHLENHTVIEKKTGRNISGANLCLGRPGLIFMLLRLNRGETLSRGAVYTYYEAAGGVMKPEALDKKLKFATIQPPKWTVDFEVQQVDESLAR